ncbi:hypothetical protein [Actinoplanes aureus]|uniref:Uncharacterized protein n=1 Tax=Actinoplanes aureus TaxID=2792083 RepID=A0A931C8Q0_9ACTN|nr:hypothetical protein [Actinoplanes aureus]MBG0562553.1 hypothetical protein [Actinoplanes aureus]
MTIAAPPKEIDVEPSSSVTWVKSIRSHAFTADVAMPTVTRIGLPLGLRTAAISMMRS